MKILAISRDVHASPAALRAARTLERYLIKQIMTTKVSLSLLDSARLLSALIDWDEDFVAPKRMCFNAPKMRKRR